MPNFVQLFLLKHNDLKIRSTAGFLSISKLEQKCNCNFAKYFIFVVHGICMAIFFFFKK